MSDKSVSGFCSISSGMGMLAIAHFRALSDTFVYISTGMKVARNFYLEYFAIIRTIIMETLIIHVQAQYSLSVAKMYTNYSKEMHLNLFDNTIHDRINDPHHQWPYLITYMNGTIICAICSV